jgi:rare lipoprotein A (peptidoglycan hydrolase)
VSFPTHGSRRRTAAGLTAFACLAALCLGTTSAAADGGGLDPAVAPAAAAATAGQITPADLAHLDAALHVAEQASAAAADDLFQAASDIVTVRLQIEESSARAEAARSALTDRIRDIYMAGKPDQLTRVLSGFGATNGLAHLAKAGVRSDQSLIAEVDRESRELDGLRRRAATQEAALKQKAARLDALQLRTLALLSAAQVKYADDQAALLALAQRRAQLEEQRRQIEQQQQALAQAAQQTLTGVTPAVTERGQAAAAAEAPIIAALEAAGSNFPPGYRATGRTISGVASWYGPGFYGHPTATGAPYDAERFTCAMLAVPLGTVVRVTTADGRAVNVLVNDRGPYVGNRIIDMSAAGARMLGYDGIKQVTVEVLEPVG